MMRLHPNLKAAMLRSGLDAASASAVITYSTTLGTTPCDFKGMPPNTQHGSATHQCFFMAHQAT